MATNITQIYLFLKDRYIRFLLKLSLSIVVPHSTPHSRVSLTYPLDSHFVPHHARSHTLTLCNLIPVTLTYLIPLLFLDLTILLTLCFLFSWCKKFILTSGPFHELFPLLSSSLFMKCSSLDVHFTVSLAVGSWFHHLWSVYMMLLHIPVTPYDFMVS